MIDIKKIIRTDYKFIGEQHKEAGVLVSRVVEPLRERKIPETVVELYDNYESYTDKTLDVLKELIELKNKGEKVVTYSFTDEKYRVLLLFAYAYRDIIKLTVVHDGFILFRVSSIYNEISSIASYIRRHLTILGYLTELTS